MIIVVVVVWTCDGHEFSELHVLKGGVFSRPHLCSTYLSNTTELTVGNSLISDILDLLSPTAWVHV